MPKKSSKPVIKKVLNKAVAEFEEKTIEVEEGNFVEKVANPKILMARANSKISQLIEMIKSTEEGIALKQICENLKWQPHTARSVISRLNKNQNLGIVTDKIAKGNRVYKLPKKDKELL